MSRAWVYKMADAHCRGGYAENSYHFDWRCIGLFLHLHDGPGTADHPGWAESLYPVLCGRCARQTHLRREAVGFDNLAFLPLQNGQRRSVELKSASNRKLKLRAPRAYYLNAATQ
jgi:hypothetical protein